MAIPRALRALFERPDATRTLGPFRLIRTLGSGGFAPVWLAAETHGEVELRLAAVKLFALTDSSQASEQRLQILQEAQALCRVEHPNIVRFYALPTDSTLGVMGLAMEYVAGTSLDARLAAEGRLGAQEVVTIGISIASALAAVHRASLVHRDVKPANVVEAGGLHKLIDFGISAADAFPRAGPDVIELDDLPLAPSAALSAALADVAAIRHVSGTLGYVDPAVARGQSPATPSSDLYSLGALLFECTTGRLPAAAGGGEGLDAQVLEGHARPPSVLSSMGRSLRCSRARSTPCSIPTLRAAPRPPRGSPRCCTRHASRWAPPRARSRTKTSAPFAASDASRVKTGRSTSGERPRWLARSTCCGPEGSSPSWGRPEVERAALAGQACSPLSGRGASAPGLRGGAPS
ncbi:MAG: protein kinase [Myxococcales bacterium]|nr:protein kinase [Myxococcales bacterium]